MTLQGFHDLRFKGLGLSWGLGIRVDGLGFRVDGLGLRVCGVTHEAHVFQILGV